MNNFCNLIQRKVLSEDGESMAPLFSLETFHPSAELVNQLRAGQGWMSIVDKHIESPWNAILLSHLRAYREIVVEDDYPKAFQNKCNMMNNLAKVLNSVKDKNWMLPIVYSNAKELRKMSIILDETMPKKSDSDYPYQEEAASVLMGIFRVCTTDLRNDVEVSKRLGLMTIINQLMRIYFRIQKQNLCKPLMRALENANLDEYFTLADRVTYNYLKGVKAIVDEEYIKAEEALEWAFKHCDPRQKKNIHLIAQYLIPVKIYYGIMPTTQFLKDQNLEIYEDFVKAIKEGDMYYFEVAFNKHESEFLRNSLIILMGKLKRLVYRTLVKKVCLVRDSFQLEIEVLRDAFNFSKSNRGTIKLDEEDAYTIDDVHCVIANFVYHNYIKGYISRQHHKLVISKQNAFPDLHTVTN